MYGMILSFKHFVRVKRFQLKKVLRTDEFLGFFFSFNKMEDYVFIEREREEVYHSHNIGENRNKEFSLTFTTLKTNYKILKYVMCCSSVTALSYG